MKLNLDKLVAHQSTKMHPVLIPTSASPSMAELAKRSTPAATMT